MVVMLKAVMPLLTFEAAATAVAAAAAAFPCAAAAAFPSVAAATPHALLLLLAGAVPSNGGDVVIRVEGLQLLVLSQTQHPRGSKTPSPTTPHIGCGSHRQRASGSESDELSCIPLWEAPDASIVVGTSSCSTSWCSYLQAVENVRMRLKSKPARAPLAINKKTLLRVRVPTEAFFCREIFSSEKFSKNEFRDIGIKQVSILQFDCINFCDIFDFESFINL